MTLSDVIGKFTTSPFLFIGSGLSRRYLNLPDWKGLLKHFADIVGKDEFSYNFYENKANFLEHNYGIMPKIADLIENDFDNKWFNDPTIRTTDEFLEEQVKSGISPFKAEIAAYTKRCSKINNSYIQEIQQLIKVSEKSITGIITTNYDTFLEDNFKGYIKYVGQSQLIFSAIQGIAEIYKIHGSIECPDSIVINSSDYEEFERKSAYLAAKLMTIFVEYPIIFMGYSISDRNIINIIKSIINCLSKDQVNRLQDRFVFVEYEADKKDIEVSPFTFMIEDKPMEMTKIKTSDFLAIYNELEKKKSKLPVRLLRRFKQEIYSYTITNTPTSKLRVASIDDERISDDDLVLAIGKVDDFGRKGLSGIIGNEWYRNIVLEDINATADDLLEFAFKPLLNQNSQSLPIHKLLSEAKKSFPEYEDYAKGRTFDRIISKTIKKNRRILGTYRSVKDIWESEKNDLKRATDLIAHLEEADFDVSELENVLKELFNSDKDILTNAEQALRTNIRRLILIYDYLKWGKNKEPPN